MIQMTVDKKPISIAKGSTVLQAVRACGIDMPTLCYHEELTPYGSCRLCMVSITVPSNMLVASCTHPVEEGMVVATETSEATRARAMVMEFLLGRCPQSTVIQELAANVGVTTSRFQSSQAEDGDGLCVLCGLCVRVCRELVGASAIGFSGRGEKRAVGTPFDVHSEACIGCGACAGICPTGAIKMEDRGNQRILHTWNTKVELQGCTQCGAFFAPGKMAFLKEMIPTIESLWDICPQCRRKQTVRLSKQKS